MKTAKLIKEIVFHSNLLGDEIFPIGTEIEVSEFQVVYTNKFPHGCLENSSVLKATFPDKSVRSISDSFIEFTCDYHKEDDEGAEVRIEMPCGTITEKVGPIEETSNIWDNSKKSISNMSVGFDSKSIQSKRRLEYIKVTEEMRLTYERKNADYGDSVYISLDEDGLISSKIRMGDKINRFNNLIKPSPNSELAAESRVRDESTRDTVLDLANYALITILWYKGKESVGDVKDYISGFRKELNLITEFDRIEHNIIGDNKRKRLFFGGIYICSDRMTNQFEKFSSYVKEKRDYDKFELCESLRMLAHEAIETVIYLDKRNEEPKLICPDDKTTKSHKYNIPED